jgi:hypothetical protein
VLIRTPSSQPHDKDWFMFSAALMSHVSSDYIAMRLLHRLEPLTSALTICVLMLDVVEKSLKLHLAVQTQTDRALSDMAARYGHNVEALRDACASFTPLFADADIRDFTRHLSDRDGKLYQQLRYGSQKTTDGFSTNLSTLRPVVDKIFCESILQLPEDIRRLLVYSSPLKQLIVGSRFDQSRHPTELVESLRQDNHYYDRLSEYCHRIEKEQADLLAKFAAAQPRTDDA